MINGSRFVILVVHNWFVDMYRKIGIIADLAAAVIVILCHVVMWISLFSLYTKPLSCVSDLIIPCPFVCPTVEAYPLKVCAISIILGVFLHVSIRLILFHLNSPAVLVSHSGFVNRLKINLFSTNLLIVDSRFKKWAYLLLTYLLLAYSQ
jgi:hypothetical protein